MNEIHLLPQDEKELFFITAADVMNIPFEIIEKDYWVVWILERLFSINDLKTKLTFKGGTSLSKIYRVILRFSEDIDLSIEREHLGFSPPYDPESAPSKKKQKAVLDNLSKTCSDFIQTKVLASLTRLSLKNLEQPMDGEFFPIRMTLVLKHFYLNIQEKIQKLDTSAR